MTDILFKSIKNLSTLKYLSSLAIIIWNLTILSPVFIKNSDILYLFKLFFSTVCHQNPDKCFIYNEYSFLVCSRCLGIYLGTLMSNLFLLTIKRVKVSFKLIIISILIMVIDILFYNFNIYPYNKIIALLTGVIFGAMIFLFIFEIISEIILKNDKNE